MNDPVEAIAALLAETRHTRFLDAAVPAARRHFAKPAVDANWPYPLALALQVAKVGEEMGEVQAAFTAVMGGNARKGTAGPEQYSGLMLHLADEFLDVAISALVGWTMTVSPDADQPSPAVVAALAAHARAKFAAHGVPLTDLEHGAPIAEVDEGWHDGPPARLESGMVVETSGGAEPAVIGDLIGYNEGQVGLIFDDAYEIEIRLEDVIAWRWFAR